MANEIEVKNTLCFQFPGNAAQPTLADMGRFIKTLKSDHTKMDTAYKISDEKSVYIRFKCEDAMEYVLKNNASTLPFRYTDGREVIVSMSVAGGNTRYIRIFDLPPEVTDGDLCSVLEKYGTIKRVVRERFPADIGIDIFSGIRGLYIDVKREIPEIQFFRGRKGRIYFEGIRSKCYVCKSEAHLKKDCPIFKARQIEEAKQQQPEQSSQTQPPVTSMDEGTGEAGAPVASMEATNKQQDRTKFKKKIAETKRQLSIDSLPNNQQQQKKKINVPPQCESENDTCSMVTVSDGGDDSESESDLEAIDFTTSTPEMQQAWIKKRDRKNRRMDKKIERLLAQTNSRGISAVAFQ